MQAGDVFRLLLIVGGVLLFIFTIVELARRKLTEPLSLVWGFISLILFLAGILLRPAGLNRMFSLAGIIIVVILIIVFFSSAYFLSIQVSSLTRMNMEMAMQISLLNNENEQILKRLETLETKDGHTNEKDNFIRN